MIQYHSVLGARHPETHMAEDGLARAYSKIGQHEIALEIHHNVFCQRKALIGSHHPLTLASNTEFKKAYTSSNTTDT